MTLASVTLLLQMCLSLLSNPKLTPTQKVFVNNAAQIAEEAIAQMEAPIAITPTTQTVSSASSYTAPTTTLQQLEESQQQQKEATIQGELNSEIATCKSEHQQILNSESVWPVGDGTERQQLEQQDQQEQEACANEVGNYYSQLNALQ